MLGRQKALCFRVNQAPAILSYLVQIWEQCREYFH